MRRSADGFFLICDYCREPFIAEDEANAALHEETCDERQGKGRYDG